MKSPTNITPMTSAGTIPATFGIVEMSEIVRNVNASRYNDIARVSESSANSVTIAVAALAKPPSAFPRNRGTMKDVTARKQHAADKR